MDGFRDCCCRFHHLCGVVELQCLEMWRDINVVWEGYLVGCGVLAGYVSGLAFSIGPVFLFHEIGFRKCHFANIVKVEIA